jgi:hypothetical protein
MRVRRLLGLHLPCEQPSEQQGQRRVAARYLGLNRKAQKTDEIPEHFTSIAKIGHSGLQEVVR